MIDLPKMTEAQAYLYLDFVAFRLMGWEVVERMKHHPRSNAAKRSLESFRNLIGEQPPLDAFVAAAMAGDPVHLLWPEHLRAEVERQINTKVPRAINEPTSEEFIRSMHEGGRTDWVLPDFLTNHGRVA
ncbi:hypothetical protein [Neorhizobium galegae]|uniref:hypothetical protein n=1 Tax=Neorhizobium galegae TaxID=399 RepID=UPI001F41F978|nr:hypothetical protein [Neorhizobium galegae]UIK05027.1 hypothetical protein LZK81_20620 [Neorhizobium galegae]